MFHKKKPRISNSDLHLQTLVEQFKTETGCAAVDLVAFTAWAEAKGEFKPSKARIRQQFRRDVASALSKDFIEDENGDVVRRQHCFTTPTQQTLWKNIDDLTPDEMRVSYQVSRRRIGGEVFQKQRDINYYNKNINPGDPIETSWNYDADIELESMPTDYPDAPPDED